MPRRAPYYPNKQRTYEPQRPSALPLDLEDSAESKDEIKEQKNCAVVSEVLITKLETAESGLNSIRGQVDLAKAFFDDLLYKMESAIQIIEIIKMNEERKHINSAAQVTDQKTEKDTVDDLLELLQTPALQGVLRQLLVSILIGKEENAQQ